jgi:hypothetical protein
VDPGEDENRGGFVQLGRGGGLGERAADIAPAKLSQCEFTGVEVVDAGLEFL